MPWSEVSVIGLRGELVMLARQPGANLAALCRGFGISRKTGLKWLRRAAAGERGDRSRRPCSGPLRTLATPKEIETWSVTSLRERLIKTGARLVKHTRHGVLQIVEAALPRAVVAGLLGLINGLRGPPAVALSA